MTASSRWRPLLSLAVVLGLLASAAPEAQAQARWTADKKASLAWWQINPHMDHLWATTCPQEPSWRPGEGRSAGWVVNKWLRPPKQGSVAISDTSIIPLYPRRRVRFVCSEAVEANVVVANPAKWGGVKGEVTVKADALIGGLDIRDAFTREKILQTNNYPEIKFTIDSMVDVTTHLDTLHAVAVGVFTLRGVNTPMRANLRYWPESGGLRVLGKFKILAHDLIPVYGMSGLALGMGVGTLIWQDVYMGVDLLMRPSEGTNSSN